MSVFNALAFSFRRENQKLFLFVTILNLIWIGTIILTGQIIQPSKAYATSIPITYGFTIFAFGYMSYTLGSRMAGEKTLPLPHLVKEFKRGILIGLALLLYNFPTMALFWFWLSKVQVHFGFRPDAVVEPASASPLFVISLGLFAFLIAFLASVSFLMGVLRYSASNNPKELFDIAGNFSQISWKLLLNFELFTSFFILWLVNRFAIIAFNMVFTQLITVLIRVLGYDSPLAPLSPVVYHTAISLINFFACLSYIWLLADYAEKLEVVAEKPVRNEAIQEQ
jgi:hypothetical protein